MNKFDLYKFQQTVMPVLLGWGLGSFVSGLVWWRGENAWRSGIGSQFALWGLIDAAIAAFGLRSAHRNSEKFDTGTITPTDHEKHARQFETIIWLNAVLDIGYIAGGSWLIVKFPKDSQRKGIGWGVLFQGSFLFIWDMLLGILVHRSRRAS